MKEIHENIINEYIKQKLLPKSTTKFVISG